MRQQLLKASKYLQSGEALEGLTMDGKPLGGWYNIDMKV